MTREEKIALIVDQIDNNEKLLLIFKETLPELLNTYEDSWIDRILAIVT